MRSPLDTQALLAHRYPFLLIDRITSVEDGLSAEAIKLVTGNEWFFGGGGAGGSFPLGTRAVPGGLVVEALAQLTAAVLIGLVDETEDAVGYFMGLDQVRYRGYAKPGDELRLTAKLLRFRRGICRTRGEAWVDGKRIVRAEITTAVRPAPRRL
jgi:3-hydroxyacyl-[acyl-carrier-protein] dehydratase